MKYLTEAFTIILAGIALIIFAFYLAAVCTVRIVINDKNDKI